MEKVNFLHNQIQFALYFCVLTIFFPLFCSAQENFLFSQNIAQRQMYTPAGVLDSSSVALFYRKQWAGLEDAPETVGFAGNLTNGKNGFGLRFFNDRAGLFLQNSVFFQYGFYAKIKENQGLLLAAGFGLKMLNFNTNGLSDKEFSDPVLLRAKNNTRFASEFSLGYNINHWKFSLTFPHLFQKNVAHSEVSLTPVSQSNHFIIAGSYKHDFQEVPLSIEPILMYKKGAVRSGQTDFGLNVEWKKMLGLGFLYRTDFGLAFLPAFHFKKITIAYAYEISPVERGVRGGSSHEIRLAYQLKNLKRKFKIHVKDTLSIDSQIVAQRTDTIKSTLPEAEVQTDVKTVNTEKTEKIFEKGKVFLAENILFKKGTAELTLDSKNYLDSLTEIFEKNDVAKISITVHVGVFESALHAKLLSEQRAKVISDYFVKQGFSRKAIFTFGMSNGSPLIERPKDENEDLKNERTEITAE
jgi:type IX secretion system PorP/SprF family membrane protein